ALIERKAIDGLSIGFRTVRATRDAGTGHRRLWAVELWEISVVTFPMLAEARIAAEAPAPLNRSLQAAISLLKH
ncbi:MAG: HK97 family phage prohead protease, partial [Devosia sp.]|nr:HK97 family phage prohead protease [Devosia sp.]